MSLKNMKAMKAERGFTIVELLIVVVIIGVLAAIVVVAYNGVTNRAKASKVDSAVATVLKKVEAYNAEIGNYPQTVAALTGAASTTSYYMPAGTVTRVTTMTAAPSDEATIIYYYCTGGGVRIGYYDYQAGAAVTTASTKTAGTTTGTCTAATS